MTRIRVAREHKGWSQAELARRAKLNVATLSLIESGRMQPYPVQLRKIARALGTTGNELEGRNDAAHG